MVADSSGVYLLAENSAIGAGEVRLVRLSCDGAEAVGLAEPDVRLGLEAPRRYLAQTADDVLVAEGRNRITAYGKADGAARTLVSGEEDLFDFRAEVLDDELLMSWMSGTSLRLRAGDAEPRTVVANLPSNMFGSVCRTEALLDTHTLLLCSNAELWSVPHDGGAPNILTPFREADDILITAPTVDGDRVLFAAGKPCARDICDIRDAGLWSVSYVNGAWGSAREIRDLASDFETIGRLAVAGGRLVVAGSPQGRTSTSQSTVRSFPLEGLAEAGGRTLASVGRLAGTDGNHAYLSLRNAVLQSPFDAEGAEGVPVEAIAERPSCPADSDVFTRRESPGPEVGSVAVAADASGVYVLPSTVGDDQADLPLLRLGCDGTGREALGTFDVRVAQASRPNTLARGADRTFVVESGRTVRAFPDSGGAPETLAEGEDTASAILAVDGDVFWLAKPGLRTVADGSARTLARLPSNPFTSDCTFAGADPEEVFVVCGREEVRAISRADGSERAVRKEAGKPGLSAVLRGTTLWLVRQVCPKGETCEENFERRPELWKMPADGSAEPEFVRDISLVYEGLPSFAGFTDTHLVLNGPPLNRTSSLQNTVAAVRLDGTGDVELLSTDSIAAAVDEGRAYLRRAEPDGYSVEAVKP